MGCACSLGQQAQQLLVPFFYRQVLLWGEKFVFPKEKLEIRVSMLQHTERGGGSIYATPDTHSPQNWKEKMMQTLIDRKQENPTQSASNWVTQNQRGKKPKLPYVGQRSGKLFQRKLQEMANRSPQVKQMTVLQDLAKHGTQAKPLIRQKAEDDHDSPYPQQPIQLDGGRTRAYLKEKGKKAVGKVKSAFGFGTDVGGLTAAVGGFPGPAAVTAQVPTTVVNAANLGVGGAGMLTGTLAFAEGVHAYRAGDRRELAARRTAEFAPSAPMRASGHLAAEEATRHKRQGGINAAIGAGGAVAGGMGIISVFVPLIALPASIAGAAAALASLGALAAIKGYNHYKTTRDNEKAALALFQHYYRGMSNESELLEEQILFLRTLQSPHPPQLADPKREIVNYFGQQPGQWGRTLVLHHLSGALKSSNVYIRSHAEPIIKYFGLEKDLGITMAKQGATLTPTYFGVASSVIRPTP